MILSDKLLDLFLLFRKEFGYIRCTLHRMHHSVWRHERIKILGTERHDGTVFSNYFFVTIINLPFMIIKTNAIGATIT